MFKNPLKYQSGGSTPTQQQQEQLVQLFQAAAQNAQVDPEALVKKAQELGQDENAAAQFMEGLQKCAQGDPAGIQFIKSLFTPSHKRGGKIQDFICKHGKGGAVAGCGCEKPVLKGQEAIPGGMPRFQAPTNYYNEKGWSISERDAIRRNNRTFYTEEPNTAGNLAWTNNQMASQLMWPGVVQDIQYNPPVGHYIDEYGNMHNFAVQGEDLTRYNNRKAQWKGDGGKVEKAQEGNIMLQPGEETVWDIKKDTLRNGTLESHKWTKNDSTLPMPKSEVMQWPGTYSRFIDGRDTILVRQTPMFNFYRSSLDPLHEIVTYSDGTPAGTNTYKTRASWNKENQYHDKLK